MTLARLPRGPGVEVRAILAPGETPPPLYETWIRDPAGAWWRSELPAEVTPDEESALALGLLRLMVAAGRWDAEEIAREIQAEAARQRKGDAQ